MVAHIYIGTNSHIPTMSLYVSTQPHHNTRINSPGTHAGHGNGHFIFLLTQHNYTGTPQHIPHTTTHTRRSLHNLSSPQIHLITTCQLCHLLGSPPSIRNVGHHRNIDQNKASDHNHHCGLPSPINSTHPAERPQQKHTWEGIPGPLSKSPHLNH